MTRADFRKPSTLLKPIFFFQRGGEPRHRRVATEPPCYLLPSIPLKETFVLSLKPFFDRGIRVPFVTVFLGRRVTLLFLTG